MNKNNFFKNRENLVKKLDKASIVAVFAGIEKHKSADAFYTFTPNRNFYYLTGIERENMILLMNSTNNSTYLFIEENTEYKEKWLGARMSKEKASEISGIEEKNIFYLEAFEKHFQSLLTSRMNLSPKYLYLDLLRDKGNEHPETFEFARKVKDKYPELIIQNLEFHLNTLRMIKTKEEIDEIKKAVDITKEGIESLMKNSKVGLYEYQLESYYKQSIMYNNSSESFPTIAASGGNATVLHYVDNNSLLKDNTLILFDLGAYSSHYCSDITRTFPVNGKFTERQKEIYEVVLKANKESIKHIKPGMTFVEINKFARDILIEGCKGLGLMTEDKDISKFYYHGLGHYLGLDVHDVGHYKTIEEGMVLTIEPGLYIKEENIGVRIEDDIVITKDGCINLSSNIIKEVDEIEKFMKNTPKNQ
ncbi:aminopeptidase P family protein [Mycoplasmatota bacterium zrk1]